LLCHADELLGTTNGHSMPIDLGQVDWLYVVILAVFAFVANVVANALSFQHRWISAVLAAAVFATIFVFWTYYPHGLPLPTSIASRTSSVIPGVPAAPATPQRPSNPVTDITPAPATPR
jgi:hypothetical protein